MNRQPFNTSTTTTQENTGISISSTQAIRKYRNLKATIAKSIIWTDAFRSKDEIVDADSPIVSRLIRNNTNNEENQNSKNTNMGYFLAKEMQQEEQHFKQTEVIVSTPVISATMEKSIKEKEQKLKEKQVEKQKEKERKMAEELERASQDTTGFVDVEEVKKQHQKQLLKSNATNTTTTNLRNTKPFAHTIKSTFKSSTNTKPFTNGFKSMQTTTTSITNSNIDSPAKKRKRSNSDAISEKTNSNTIATTAVIMDPIFSSTDETNKPKSHLQSQQQQSQHSSPKNKKRKRNSIVTSTMPDDEIESNDERQQQQLQQFSLLAVASRSNTNLSEFPPSSAETMEINRRKKEQSKIQQKQQHSKKQSEQDLIVYSSREE